MEHTDALFDLIAALAKANESLLEAAAASDAAQAERLLREIAVIERRRNRLVHQHSNDVRALESEYQSSPPLRDQVIRALQLITRPATGRLVTDVTAARWGERIQAAMLSSLRRDEARSWRNAHDVNRRTAVRDVYVVPALSYDRFAPVRSTLALSSWSSTMRLIAPLSPRVDMLHSTVAIAEETIRVAGTAYETPMRRLAARLGATIPGVASFDAEPSVVIEAAKAELAQIEETDTDERAEAAERADTRLDDEACLFGATLQTVPVRAAGGSR